MSYSGVPIEEIHTLQDKLERLSEDFSNITESEILKVSDEIDTILAK